MTAEAYFSRNYSDSRERFVTLSESHGAALHSWTHPWAKGPEGEELVIDAAVFGSDKAERVFFNINGTHGNESYAGAAAQLALIESGALDSLDDGCSGVLVHCLNPFGWAHDTQLNEELSNVNRNFVDFQALPGSDELHTVLEERLAFRELSFAALADAWRDFQRTEREFGEARFQSAFMTGQYIAPHSINYGGASESWSAATLRGLARRVLGDARLIALIDWHTGLGSYGAAHELPLCNPGTEAWELTGKWWGEEAMTRGEQGLITGESGTSDATANLFSGVAIEALREAAPEATIAGGIVELGTTLFPTMLQSCILDGWLMFNELEKHPEYRFWKALSLDVLSPRDSQWRESVMQVCSGFYESSLQGLLNADL